MSNDDYGIATESCSTSLGRVTCQILVHDVSKVFYLGRRVQYGRGTHNSGRQDCSRLSYNSASVLSVSTDKSDELFPGCTIVQPGPFKAIHTSSSISDQYTAELAAVRAWLAGISSDFTTKFAKVILPWNPFHSVAVAAYVNI